MNAPPPSTLTFPFDAPPPPGAAREIVPGVTWIRMPLPFALDHINLWLLRVERGFVAVDSGYGDAPTRALWQRHFDATLGGLPIMQVLATHYHPDHVGNAAWLASRFDCPVTMTLSEYLTGVAVRNASPGYGPDDMTRLFAAHGMADDHLEAMTRRGNPYAKGVPELPRSIRRVQNGQTLRFGELSWRVIEGFGHSPEHVSLYCAQRGVLISGDMLLPRISTNVSVWGSEPDADPLAQFLGSLRSFEGLPADTLVLPSHGLPFRGIAPRVGQLRSHHAARLAELESAVAERGGEASATDIVPLLFRRPLDMQQRYFATGEAIAHLNHLWHAGALERRIDSAAAVKFATPHNGRGTTLSDRSPAPQPT